MDENNQNHGGSNWCGCGMCQSYKRGMNQWHGGHGHFLARLVIGLVILLMVFCLGMAIGEFHGEFRSGHGYSQYRTMPLPGDQMMFYRQ